MGSPDLWDIGLLLGNLSFVACLPQLTHCLGTGSCPNHTEIKTRGQRMNSSQVVDRDEAVKALVQSMESTAHTGVGGQKSGKNVP